MKDPEIDLEKYFGDSKRNLPVKRGELRSILAYLVDKKSFAESLIALDQELVKQMRDDIRAIVQEELGLFMVKMNESEGDKKTDSGIVLL